MTSSRRGQPWTDAEDAKLKALQLAKAPLPEMIAALSRSGEAIDRRLANLGLPRTGRTRRHTVGPVGQ